MTKELRAESALKPYMGVSRPVFVRAGVFALVALSLVGTGADAAPPPADAIRQLLDDRSLSTPERERRLEAAVIDLARHEPTPETIQLIASLHSHQPAVYVSISEGRGRSMVPAFDIAAAAGFVERAWISADAESRMGTAIVNGGPLGSLLVPGETRSVDSWTTGILKAIDSASGDRLADMRGEIIALVGHSGTADAAAVRTAARLSDALMLAEVVDRATGRVALDAVSAAAALPTSSQRVMVIEAGLGRAYTASAAVVALGDLAPTMPSAERRLVDLLGDSELGGSASLALARSMNPALQAELRSLAGLDGIAASRAALALELAKRRVLE